MSSSDHFNEDSLIRFLADEFPPTHSGTLGIGDDCAAISIDKENSLLLTTDSLIEGTHFTVETISAEQLGYKAVAVNLSDIAAMGGRPQSVLISLGIPSKIEKGWIQQFFKGVKTLLQKHQVDLIGGDTVRSEKGIVISVTALGRATSRKIKKRSAAQVGDLICVTKTLGDSTLGLLALQNKKNLGEVIHRHLQPEAEVDVGIWLSQREDVHAMMDLSDGLKADLTKLTQASNCGGEITIEQLPLSDSAAKAAEILNSDIEMNALTGGEDYALLFTVEASSFANFKSEYETQFQRPLFNIGKVTESKELVFKKNGRTLENIPPGFQHF